MDQCITCTPKSSKSTNINSIRTNCWHLTAITSKTEDEHVHLKNNFFYLLYSFPFSLLTKWLNNASIHPHPGTNVSSDRSHWYDRWEKHMPTIGSCMIGQYEKTNSWHFKVVTWHSDDQKSLFLFGISPVHNISYRAYLIKYQNYTSYLQMLHQESNYYMFAGSPVQVSVFLFTYQYHSNE